LVNLADQNVNMHVTAVLSKAMSDSVGGTSVGGFMNTALANKNGELVIPVLVTGSLGSPRFAPDVEKIARMKLDNLLPTSSKPGDLTSGILGAVLGRKSQNQPQSDQTNGGAPQQQPPKSGIQGILQGLGGNKGATTPQTPTQPQSQPQQGATQPQAQPQPKKPTW